MDRALEIARSKGGITLEGVINENKIIMPEYIPTDPVSKEIWLNVSEEYARQASGEVRAIIGKQLRPGNIWERELDILKANKNVTKITMIDPETLVETIIFTRK